MASSASRPSTVQSDYGARPPERIDTLPPVSRPEAAPKPAAATLADAGVKAAMPPRPQPMARPAAASIAEAGIKPMAAGRVEPAVRPAATELTVKAAAAPAVRPESTPVAKAPVPKAEPAPKPEAKSPAAKAKPEAKPSAPAADGEHRCDDCGKTEAETTFPRKGDWVSRVCRSCRKSRGLRP
jgi:hypothetical protein